MKREIEFDFAKWGQEGISILDQNKNEVLNLWKLSKPANQWIYLVEVDNANMPFFLNEFGKNDNVDTKLQMFEEVKPREFWVNVYEGGSIGIYNDKISAETAYNSSMKYAPKIKGETIKVVEVLE